MNVSVWSERAEKPRFEELQGDIKTGVLIVGGGIAGLLCAHVLNEAGVDCVLVEAEEICGGVTGNTTAKITAQHGLIYHTLLKRFGEERTRKYLEANLLALKKYRKLCKNVDCDFEDKDAYVYSTDKPKRIEKELLALEKIGYSAKFDASLPMPFPVAGAVRFEKQAQFHPLKFAYAIAKNLRIYERTRVLKITEDGAVTDRGKIRADKYIVTTHFPFIDRHGLYFMKLFQHRSYVLALKNAPNVKGMYLGESETGLSFRNYGELLLLGGGDHRTGEKGGNWRVLEEFAAREYLNAEITYRWAAQDCMSLDGVPYIGRYSKNTPNLFVATGFNKWGMTSSMVAADILKDMILEKDNPYAEVFSPSRSMLRKQLFVNVGKTALNLITPTTPRCPHLGCALKYNPQEHSWDCPCHGSRFTKEGTLLDNPANKDRK